MTGYGVFSAQGSGDGKRSVGFRAGDGVVDLAAAAREARPDLVAYLDGGTLDPLLAAGREVWAEVDAAAAAWAAEGRHVVDRASVTLHLPFTVADYVDFYASEEHATNVGRMFRPDEPPLVPSWKHLPIGYHGRAGTVVVSGTDVIRPSGQRRTADGEVIFAPSVRLDIEAEVGFVVGVPSELGTPVPLADVERHLFGVCLVNDWSARDIQAWEYRPLGPFLAKSFLTSVSPWVVPLSALSAARVPPPRRDEPLLPHLDDTDTPPWGLDLSLEVRLNGEVVARPPYSTMYWTPAQMLAHLTSNGASLRTGDLYASGTVSGPRRDQVGSLLERTWNGSEPIALSDGSTRTFLQDGDEVVIAATAPGADATVVDLGEVRGRVLPAR